MPKRSLNAENVSTHKICRLDTSNNSNGGSNVRNFYGSKKPMPNLCWIPKMNYSSCSSSSQESSSTNDATNQDIFQNSRRRNNKTNNKLMIELNKPDNTCSPTRKSKRLVDNDLSKASSKRASKTSAVSPEKTPQKRISKFQNNVSIDNCSSPRKTPERRCKHNYIKISDTQASDKTKQKLRNLFQQIDKIVEESGDVRETNETILSSSIQTQTSLCSSQDTSTPPSISPVTSCRSSPFSPTIIGQSKTDSNSKSGNIQNKDLLNNESPLPKEEEEEEEETYEMFNCDVESHETSVRSESSRTCISPSPKKTPKSRKTILNYFSRIDSTEKGIKKSANKIKSPTDPEKDKHKNSNHKQLHFSDKGLSPKSTKKM